MICGKSNIEVVASSGKKIVLSNFFTTVGLTTQEDWKNHGKKSEAYIRFNPLVTKSIKDCYIIHSIPTFRFITGCIEIELKIKVDFIATPH